MTETAPRGPKPPLLVARGITKTFDRTRALAGADFRLHEREIHGLLGANGAGKSTLSKIIAGHQGFEDGEIVYRSYPVRLRSTRDALRIGIAMVTQETSLVPDLTVLENMFLPELGRSGRLDYPGMRRRGQELLASLGQADALPLAWEVRRLSSAQKQIVEIAKALGVGAKLIIFDEPTASLSPTEVDRLFDIMARLRLSNRGLIFVSHRLEEVFTITDRVTVMREGRTVMDARPTTSLNQAELIRAMVGADLGAIYRAPHPASHAGQAPVALEVRNLASGTAVRDVSFTVHRGEILGLGGLVGAGRSETVEAVFGLRPRSAGTVTLGGVNLRAGSPRAAIRAGMGFVAEDRRSQNIVPDLTVRENLLLAHLGAHRGFGLGYRKRDARVAELLALLGLPADRLLDASMLTFSGGMQQKIIMARWLLLDPRVLILDEPTKGVDIGTRASIYAMLREIAGRGVAIVVVSSDFEELLGLCDRITVMSDGRSVADLPSAMLDEEKSHVAGGAPHLHGAQHGAAAGPDARERRSGLLGAHRGRSHHLPQCGRLGPGRRPGLQGRRGAGARRHPHPGGAAATGDGFRGGGRRRPLDDAAADPQRPRPRPRLGGPEPARRPGPASGRRHPHPHRHIGSDPMSTENVSRSTPDRTAPGSPAPSWGKALSRRLEVRMLLLAVAIAVVLAVLSPFFLTRSNVFNMLDQSVVIGIVSVGMTFVILTGGIDLSVGSVAGLTGILLGLALQHVSIPLAVLLAVLAGGGIGLLSGLLINLFGLAAFVVTLGIMAIGRSLAYIFSGQQSISTIPDAMQDIVYTSVLGIPSNVLFLLVLYGAAWAYLTYTKGGRTIYAVGSNKEAARAAGLSTLFYSVLPYVLSGALATVAATFSIGQLLSADPLMGNAMELDAIAAVVIGGASLYGGRGSMLGTLIGVFIMVMIRNGLNLMGVSPFWQGTAIGTIIIVALLVERLVSARVNR